MYGKKDLIPRTVMNQNNGSKITVFKTLFPFCVYPMVHERFKGTIITPENDVILELKDYKPVYTEEALPNNTT